MTPAVISSSLLTASIAPEIGGSILGLELKDCARSTSLMRQSPPTVQRSSDAASFLMAPWVGRVKDGKTSYQDRPLNLPHPEKHSIHGLVRDLSWEIREQHADKLTIGIRSEHFPQLSSYPFQFEMIQDFWLNEDTFSQRLTIKNTGSIDQPVGAGFHPYFPKVISPGSGPAQLSTTLHGHFDCQELPIPEHPPLPLPNTFNFSDTRELSEGIDRCFSGWNGMAEISWPQSKIALRISGSNEMKFLVLFTPPGKSFIAVEPMSTPPNALNLLRLGYTETGVQILSPGQCAAFQMNIELLER